MKSVTFTRFVSCLALSLALLSLCGGALAQSPARRTPSADSKPLTEQAREYLADGKAVQALSLARRAAQENPEDYKAHYYVAFALMELGEFPEAVKAAERSRGLAKTQEAGAAVEQLQGTLAAQGGLKEGDAAAADGLHAKAGRLYLQAWEKGVLSPEKTLVAADLFQQHLKDGATAARMLRDLPTRHAGTPLADEAAKRLVTLRPALKEAAGDALAQARKLEPGDPDRARWLRFVIDADADNQIAQTMLANDAAESGNWAALEPQLKLLQRKGWLQGLLEGRSLSFGKWQGDAKLRTLLSDIWGEKRGAELLAMNVTDGQPLSAEALNARSRKQQTQSTAAFEAAGLKAGTGAAFRDCSNCPEMVWLAPGTVAPRPENKTDLSGWVNKVRIAYPFAVGKYQVTYDEWDACTAEGACGVAAEGFTYGAFFDSKWGRGRQPVVNVNWNDAKAYTQWLSKKTGETYRLLSVSEFIYAARAGRADNNLSAGAANCIDCASPAVGRTVPVGSYKANAWGLHDMIGNVWEMVADCNFNIPLPETAPTDGSPVRTGCTHRLPASRDVLGEDMITMGGSWFNSLNGPTGVQLGTGYERYGNNFIGFRVARTFAAK